jgi:hypothetical protein
VLHTGRTRYRLHIYYASLQRSFAWISVLVPCRLLWGWQDWNNIAKAADVCNSRRVVSSTERMSLSLVFSFSFSSVSHHNNVIPMGFNNPTGSFVCPPGNLTLSLSVLWFLHSVCICRSVHYTWAKKRKHISRLICFLPQCLTLTLRR